MQSRSCDFDRRSRNCPARPAAGCVTGIGGWATALSPVGAPFTRFSTADGDPGSTYTQSSPVTLHTPPGSRVPAGVFRSGRCRALRWSTRECRSHGPCLGCVPTWTAPLASGPGSDQDWGEPGAGWMVGPGPCFLRSLRAAVTVTPRLRWAVRAFSKAPRPVIHRRAPFDLWERRPCDAGALRVRWAHRRPVMSPANSACS